METSKRTNLA